MIRTRVWQLHEAQARFSEIFRRVRAEGPQRVKDGAEAVVIIRAEEFDRAAVGRHAESLLDFFRSAPGGAALDLKRKRDLTRTIRWL